MPVAGMPIALTSKNAPFQGMIGACRCAHRFGMVAQPPKVVSPFAAQVALSRRTKSLET
jgi:hypothetical protein